MKSEDEYYIQHNSEYSVKEQNKEQKHTNRYSAIKRKELLVWMANASEKVLFEVMQSINPSRYKRIFGKAEARLHTLLTSAEQVRNTLERSARKNPDRDLALLEDTHRLRLDMACSPKQRRSPKREKVTLYGGVIRRLAAEGYSLRQVAVYLRRETGLKITHSYLRQCCLSMGIDGFSRSG